MGHIYQYYRNNKTCCIFQANLGLLGKVLIYVNEEVA